MRSLVRALAVTLIAAVFALLWVPAAGALAEVVTQPPPVHVYDGPRYAE
jgi:hypothetical protein